MLISLVLLSPTRLGTCSYHQPKIRPPPGQLQLEPRDRDCEARYSDKRFPSQNPLKMPYRLEYGKRVAKCKGELHSRSLDNARSSPP